MKLNGSRFAAATNQRKDNCDKFIFGVVGNPRGKLSSVRHWNCLGVLLLHQDKCMAIRLDNELIANRPDMFQRAVEKPPGDTLKKKFVKRDKQGSHSRT